MTWIVHRITGWTFTEIEAQPTRWLRILTDAHKAIDWNPPTLDDVRLD